MGDFEKDLKASEVATRKLLKILKNKGFKVIKTSDSKEYDFILRKGRQSCKVEFKNDIMAEKTGNIAFEKISRGKPSGICATEAKYLLYQIGEAYYVVETIKLLQFLLAFPVSTVRGGDDNTSVMFLLPVLTFKKLNFVKRIV